MLIPTIALAVVLALLLGGAAAWSKVAQKQYLNTVKAEIARLQPLQLRAASLRRETDHARARAKWLDQYRTQTRADLDLLNELTKLVQPPAWTNSIIISRESVRLTGEAPQATALWKILDGSQLFKNSKLDSNQPASGGGETFVISAAREAGK
jgi:hypothetical protein